MRLDARQKISKQILMKADPNTVAGAGKLQQRKSARRVSRLYYSVRAVVTGVGRDSGRYAGSHHRRRALVGVAN